MHISKPALVLAGLLLVSVGAAADNGKHGLSAFGELKYPVDFKHFEWVNPDAPKGGRLSMIGTAALTTFDSFNAFILKGDGAQGLGHLYDTLMTLRPSPVVALSRAIAVAEHQGAERGLTALAAIDDRQRLQKYPFYFAALGDMELRCARYDSARTHFRTALTLARSAAERNFLERRISVCDDAATLARSSSQP